MFPDFTKACCWLYKQVSSNFVLLPCSGSTNSYQVMTLTLFQGLKCVRIVNCKKKKKKILVHCSLNIWFLQTLKKMGTVCFVWLVYVKGHNTIFFLILHLNVSHLSICSSCLVCCMGFRLAIQEHASSGILHPSMTLSGEPVHSEITLFGWLDVKIPGISYLEFIMFFQETCSLWMEVFLW